MDVRAALVANSGLQLLDLATTAWFLGAGGQEGNPVVRALLESAGIWTFVTLKVLLAIAFLLLAWRVARLDRPLRSGARRASIAFGALMLLVVVNNVAVAVA